MGTALYEEQKHKLAAYESGHQRLTFLCEGHLGTLFPARLYVHNKSLLYIHSLHATRIQHVAIYLQFLDCALVKLFQGALERVLYWGILSPGPCETMAPLSG